MNPDADPVFGFLDTNVGFLEDPGFKGSLVNPPSRVGPMSGWNPPFLLLAHTMWSLEQAKGDRAPQKYPTIRVVPLLHSNQWGDS